MIFLTVGSQMAFDRLVGAVDEWVGSRPDVKVLAQIGESGTEPRYLDWVRSMGPVDFRATIQASSVVVAHAGMGTILTALELQRPVIVFPRLGALRETRNDHQTATARALSERGLVTLAETEADLCAALDRSGKLSAPDPGQFRREEARLIGEVRAFVHGASIPAAAELGGKRAQRLSPLS